MDGVEIEYRTDEHGEREDDDKAADDAVDDLYAVHVELCTYFINQPCQAVPPQQRTRDEAHIAERHFQRMVWNDEGKLSVAGDEQKDNQWVGECNEEGCERIVPQSAFALATLVHILPWIASEAVDAKQQQNSTSGELQDEFVGGVCDEIHDEAHTQTRDERIDNVAYSCSNACNKTIPAPFVECALYAEYAHRPHRC